MSPVVSKGKRTRRDRRRPITRQRIVDATRELVIEGGSGSLTKAAICERANVDRAIIYDHFPDVESCVRAAAEQLAAETVERDARLRHAIEASDLHGLPRAIHLSRVYLEAALEAPQLARLLIRCRHEDSPLGEAVRAGIERGDAGLAEDLWLESVRQGYRGPKSPTFTLCARFVNAAHREALTMLLDAPEPDVEAVARFVGSWSFHAVRAELGREPSEA